MPAVTPDLGHGTAITFSSGFLALLTGVSVSGISRNAIDTTTFATSGGKTFMPSDTYDPGELSVTMQFDTDASVPITGAAETVTITWPDAETFSASGFLTSFEITASDEEVMEATAGIKFSGNITF